MRAGESRDRATEISECVNATFVTPLEREDAQALATALDELVQTSHTVAALLSVYMVDRVRPQARRLTQLLVGCTRELPAAIRVIREAGVVAAHTHEVGALVQDGGDVARAGLADLFSEDPAPIELERWKDLFERLQEPLVAAGRAAAVLDIISAKQR